MEYFNSKTGYTLMELIISLVLVSIVVLGIVSIDTVLSNNGLDYGQKYLVKSETQTTLNHMLNDAALATGTGTNVGTPLVADQGILIGAAMGAANNNQFCIHQNQVGDVWVCYTFDPVAFQINSCHKTYNLLDGLGYRGASGACLAGTTNFVGTAFSITTLNGAASPPTFIANPVTRQLQFTMSVQNCLNNTAVSCSNTGTSTDPANNPESQVTGTVAQLQEGTG